MKTRKPDFQESQPTSQIKIFFNKCSKTTISFIRVPVNTTAPHFNTGFPHGPARLLQKCVFAQRRLCPEERSVQEHAQAQQQERRGSRFPGRFTHLIFFTLHTLLVSVLIDYLDKQLRGEKNKVVKRHQLIMNT